MEKILIISPINQWGGVNIDVGFIVEFFKNNGHEVSVLSLGDYYRDSSIFNFVPKKNYATLNELVIKKNFFLNLVLLLANFLKPLNIPLSHRAKNKYFKKYFGLKRRYTNILSEEIKEHDVIFICSHLTGEFVEEIVKESSKHSKAVLHRVTQQIDVEKMLTQTNIKWLSRVNSLICHSGANQSIAKKYIPTINHTVIDQCAVNEKSLLSKKVLNNCKSYYILARLERTKKIDQAVNAFKLVKNENIVLHIYGDGTQSAFLEKLAANDSRINFHTPVTLDHISDVHLKHDCLIISSAMEAGPYTGIEAMAAGNLIISTRVGAMEERLGEDYDFFYDSTQKKLTERINEITSLNREEIKKTSCRLKELYLENYSYEIIQRQYQDLIENL